MSSPFELIGTWDLVKYELIIPGEVAKDLWGSVRGRLIYSPEGAVSVLVVKMDSADLKNSEVIAYSGSYKVKEAEVVHEVFVSNINHYINKSLVRLVAFEGGNLVLISKEPIKGAMHKVTWGRMEAQRAGKLPSGSY